MELREIEINPGFQLTEIDEAENKNVAAKLEYVFSVADKKNGNGRVYPADLLKRETEKMQKRINDSAIAGQLEHPRSGITEIPKISHVITKVWLEGKNGKAQSSILRTSKGRDLLVLLKSGIKLGASTRGYGTVGANGKVDSNFELESIDFVTKPSFGDATSFTKANLIESANYLFSDSRRSLTEEQKAEIRFFEAKKAGYKGTLDDYKNIKAENEDEPLLESYGRAVKSGSKLTFPEWKKRAIKLQEN